MKSNLSLKDISIPSAIEGNYPFASCKSNQSSSSTLIDKGRGYYISLVPKPYGVRWNSWKELLVILQITIVGHLVIARHRQRLSSFHVSESFRRRCRSRKSQSTSSTQLTPNSIETSSSSTLLNTHFHWHWSTAVGHKNWCQLLPVSRVGKTLVVTINIGIRNTVPHSHPCSTITCSNDTGSTSYHSGQLIQVDIPRNLNNLLRPSRSTRSFTFVNLSHHFYYYNYYSNYVIKQLSKLADSAIVILGFWSQNRLILIIRLI